MKMETAARKARIQEMSDYIKNTPEDKQFKSFPDRVHFGIEFIGLMVEDAEEHREKVSRQREDIVNNRNAILKLNAALPIGDIDEAIADFDKSLAEIDLNLNRLKELYDQNYAKLKLIQ